MIEKLFISYNEIHQAICDCVNNTNVYESFKPTLIIAIGSGEAGEQAGGRPKPPPAWNVGAILAAVDSSCEQWPQRSGHCHTFGRHSFATADMRPCADGDSGLHQTRGLHSPRPDRTTFSSVVSWLQRDKLSTATRVL
jgi:hypothetical protein